MRDYKMRDYNKASNEYKLGRLGRGHRDYYVERGWSEAQLAAYDTGRRDRAKIERSRNRKKTAENVGAVIIGVPAAIISALLVLLAWAAVAALPFIIVLVVAHLLGAF